MKNLNRLIHCLIITIATLFLPILAGEKEMIEKESGLIKHLKDIKEYAFPLPGNNKQEIQSPTLKDFILKDFIFYKFKRKLNTIKIKPYFAHSVDKNDMQTTYTLSQDDYKSPIYEDAQIDTCKNCINAMIDPDCLKPNRAVFSYVDRTQGERFNQVSFYNNEQLIYKNLHFKDDSLGFAFMNIRNPDSFFNTQCEPKIFINNIAKFEFFNGWYTEKICTYDDQGYFRVKSTWQHYTYCLVKYIIIIGFLYGILHKLYSISWLNK